MRFQVVVVLAFLVSPSPAFAQERVDPIPVGPISRRDRPDVPDRERKPG